MATIQIKRGLQENVANLVLLEGELAVALDTGNVYIGTTAGKTHINPTGGTAETAAKLSSSRNFSITGDATAPAVEFDGTSNVALNLTIPESGVTAGTYPKVTVNSKGFVTGGANLAASDIPTLDTNKISGLGTAATKNVGTSSGNVVEVGSDGKISSDLIPSVAITDIFTVDSEAAMLQCNAQQGDIAIRSDVTKSFILSQTPATTLANWKELKSPTGGVLSVNGKTGAVTLTATDIGATDKNVTTNQQGTSKVYLSGTTNGTGTATGEQYYNADVYVEADGTLVAPTFKGSLDGNAATATKATTAETCTGNAATATKLSAQRTFGISGGVTGTATGFDGSGNITIPVTAVSPSYLSAAVPITKGGTGATSAANAVSNLGFTKTAAEISGLVDLIDCGTF